MARTKSRLTTRAGRATTSPDALTTADLILLSLLAERPMHGYELSGEYERQEVADWASVSKAQVYYAIRKLAGLGLIAPLATPEPADGRDRIVYQPTSAGRERLAAALTRVDWARARVAQPFSTWLGLSIHLPRAEVKKVLRARGAFLVEELARERASLAFILTLAGDRAKAGKAIVELVIRHMEVELAWVEALVLEYDQRDGALA